MRRSKASSRDTSTESATSLAPDTTADNSFSTTRQLARINFLYCSKGTLRDWCSSFSESVRRVAFEEARAAVEAAEATAASAALPVGEVFPLDRGGSISISNRVEK